jgi:hypothetical protein
MADDSHIGRENPCPAGRKAGASIEYSIDRRKGIVFMRLKGKLMAADIQSYTRALREDPHFVPALSEIVDLREVDDLEITPAEAISLADTADPFAMTSLRAFVSRDVSQTNVARMHQMLRSPAKTIRIFDNVEAAEQWIRSNELPAVPKKSARILPFIFR